MNSPGSSAAGGADGGAAAGLLGGGGGGGGEIGGDATGFAAGGPATGDANFGTLGGAIGVGGPSSPWNSCVNSPGCTPVGGVVRVDAILPTTKLAVGCADGRSGDGSAGSGRAAGSSGVGVMAAGIATDDLASSQSWNEVRPMSISLTMTRPPSVADISRMRDRSGVASAPTWPRSRSTASDSAPSRMCTMTGRPVEVSCALCVRIPPLSATHLRRRYRSSRLVIGDGAGATDRRPLTARAASAGGRRANRSYIVHSHVTRRNRASQFCRSFLTPSCTSLLAE